jgi:serine/threonine protein kinase
VQEPTKFEKKRFVVLELAYGGELFDYIAQSGYFSEPLARHFFKEIMIGLDHIHSNGMAHRDMKPENIMLDSNFTLKISDFGFQGPLVGKDGTGELSTQKGTRGFMAPEINLCLKYEGKPVDIFACGVILFMMVLAAAPF